MIVRSVSWGIRQLVHGPDNLATFMCQLPGNFEILNLLEPLGPVQACNGLADNYLHVSVA